MNDSYKPGFHKLIHHLDHLKKIQNKEVCGPIHVSVFPTNFCQLSCPYCCFGKTQRTDEELSFDDFKLAVDVLCKHGLKALEISGGGDPLLWTYFNQAVEYDSRKKLHLSLVTNGLNLEKIPQTVLSKFDWIRVSVQSAEYARKINMGYIPDNVKKSMSYIVHSKASLNHLKDMCDFANETNTIIRVAPNRPCTKEWEDVVINAVEQYGYPLIAFRKEFGSPAGCYMAYIRGAIDWKGNFLPCPSVELTSEHAGKIPDDFALCRIADLENWILSNPPHDVGYRCSFCNCGKEVNNAIYSMLQPMENVDFV